MRLNYRSPCPLTGDTANYVRIKYRIPSRYPILLLLLFFFQTGTGFAQFPAAAGQPGTTAIPADSSIFINWATHCEIERGFIDIADQNLGFADFGEDEFGTNQADNQVVSFGDGGSAILTFEYPIRNGEGWDFAVFENAFDDMFLELAFVEVSSDGENFFRFPPTSLTDTSVQVGPFDLITEATKLNNLAGKYRAGFGTPFDLDEMRNIPGLDVNKITHIQLIDVVGTLDDEFATFDSEGNKINDPYPTLFPSCGFDLDAVGVIHQADNTNAEFVFEKEDLNIFPNPVLSGQALFIDSKNEGFNFDKILISDLNGRVVFKDYSNKSEVILPKNLTGFFVLNLIENSNTLFRKKLIIK